MIFKNPKPFSFEENERAEGVRRGSSSVALAVHVSLHVSVCGPMLLARSGRGAAKATKDFGTTLLSGASRSLSSTKKRIPGRGRDDDKAGGGGGPREKQKKGGDDGSQGGAGSVGGNKKGAAEASAVSSAEGSVVTAAEDGTITAVAASKGETPEEVIRRGGSLEFREAAELMFTETPESQARKYRFGWDWHAWHMLVALVPTGLCWLAVRYIDQTAEYRAFQRTVKREAVEDKKFAEQMQRYHQKPPNHDDDGVSKEMRHQHRAADSSAASEGAASGTGASNTSPQDVPPVERVAEMLGAVEGLKARMAALEVGLRNRR